MKKPKGVIDAGMRYRISMALRKEYFMSLERKAVVLRCETATPSTKKDGTPKLRKGAQTYTRRYKCEVCQVDGLKITRKKIKGTKKYEPAEFAIDHISPIGSMPGTRDAPKWWSWTHYITRMFTSREGLQGICKNCHDSKTIKDKADIRSGKFYEEMAKVYPGDDDK